MKKRILAGINIQYPISRLIVDGKKTIETRTYPIPAHYIGQDLALIETPGKTGKFRSRIIAIIRFSGSFKYKSKTAFYADEKRHCVTPGSPWAWSPPMEKWGWPVTVIEYLKTPIEVKKRTGIKFTKELEV